MRSSIAGVSTVAPMCNSSVRRIFGAQQIVRNSHATKLRGLLPLTYAGLVVVVVGPAVFIRHLAPLGVASLALPHRLLLVPALIGTLSIRITATLITTLASIAGVATLVSTGAASLPIGRLLAVSTAVATTITSTVAAIVRRVAALRAVWLRLAVAAGVATGTARATVAAATARPFKGHTRTLAWADEQHDILLGTLHMLASAKDTDDARLDILHDLDYHAAVALNTLDRLSLLADDLSDHVARALHLACNTLDVALKDILDVRLLLVDQVANHLCREMHRIQLPSYIYFSWLDALIDLNLSIREPLQAFDGVALTPYDTANLVRWTLQFDALFVDVEVLIVQHFFDKPNGILNFLRVRRRNGDLLWVALFLMVHLNASSSAMLKSLDCLALATYQLSYKIAWTVDDLLLLW